MAGMLKHREQRYATDEITSALPSPLVTSSGFHRPCARAGGPERAQHPESAAADRSARRTATGTGVIGTIRTASPRAWIYSNKLTQPQGTSAAAARRARRTPRGTIGGSLRLAHGANL